MTVGFLVCRMSVMAWPQRQDSRRVISMRKANEREQKKHTARYLCDEPDDHLPGF